MTSVVIIDTETTGLDPATDSIVEVGAVLYSVQHRTIVESFSALVRGDSNAAEAVNRIPAEALKSAPSTTYARERLRAMVDSVTGPAVWMAHRAEFDQGFLSMIDSSLARRLPWVCSKFDMEWPCSKLGASCVEMALAHGVPVVSAHRALTDCMLIAKTLENVQAMGHDLTAMLARATRPKALFCAKVSYDDREKAKAAGFAWEPSSKRWLRRMAKDDVAALGFQVVEAG